MKLRKFIILTFVLVFIAISAGVVLEVLFMIPSIKATISVFFEAALNSDSNLANAQWVQFEDGGTMSYEKMQDWMINPTFTVARIVRISFPIVPLNTEDFFTHGWIYYPTTGFCEPFRSVMRYQQGEWLILDFKDYPGEGHYNCY